MHVCWNCRGDILDDIRIGLTVIQQSINLEDIIHTLKQLKQLFNVFLQTLLIGKYACSYFALRAHTSLET